MEIAEKMHEQGHMRDYKQCQEKLKNLKTEYKKVKDENNGSGHGLTTWKFMEEMDGVLGTRHTTRPAGILESMPGTSREHEEDSESENESESSIISPSATVASTSGSSNEVVPERSRVASGETGNSGSSSKQAPEGTSDHSPARKKGKITKKDSALEKALTKMMSTFAAHEQAAEERFIKR